MYKTQDCVIPRGTGSVTLFATALLYSLNVLTQNSAILVVFGIWELFFYSFCVPSLLMLTSMSLSSLPESNITVALSSNSSEVLEGDVIQLTCSVHSTTGPLSVVWQWTDKQATGPAQEVASVDRDGTVWHSPAYRERSSYGEIRVEKVQGDTFSLSLYNALPGDEGQYRCTATEWLLTGTEPELNWEKIGEKSATKTVTVKTVGKFLQPNLTQYSVYSDSAKSVGTLGWKMGCYRGCYRAPIC